MVCEMKPAETRFKTVKDVESFLKQQGWSPEDLALSVPVSNMTWRRLLKQPGHTILHHKYQELLSQKFSTQVQGRIDGMNPEEVVTSGMELKPNQVIRKLQDDGAQCDDHEILFRKAKAKQKLTRVPKDLVQKIGSLLGTFPKASFGMKTLILGGVAYFINPFDLIADGVFTIGFIDDVGVVALIEAYMKKVNKNKRSQK